MISFRTVFRNAFFVLVANVINHLIAVVFIMYAARSLGPQQFGVYGLINAWIFLFSFLQNLGINIAAIRELAKDRERVSQLFNVVVTVRLILALAVYPLLLASAWLMGYPEEVRYLLYVAGIALPMLALRDSFSVLYVALERMTTPALLSVLVSIASTAASIAALHFGFGLEGVVVVGVIGTAISTVIASLWVRARIVRYRVVSDGRAMWDLVKSALPFGVLIFIHQLQRHITIILLSKLPNPHPSSPQLGYYTAAANIPNGLMVIPQSMRLAILPSLAANITNRDEVHRAVGINTKLFLVVISAPLMLLSTVRPEAVMTLIFGVEYVAAAPVFSILGIAASLYILAGPMETAISATRDIARFVPWAVLVTAVTLLGAAALIPLAGAVGAATGMLLGTLVGVYVRYRFYFAIFDVPRLGIVSALRVTAPLLALLALLVVIGRFVSSDLAMGAIAAMLYGVVILGAGVLSRTERAAVWGRLRQLAGGFARRLSS